MWRRWRSIMLFAATYDLVAIPTSDAFTTPRRRSLPSHMRRRTVRIMMSDTKDDDYNNNNDDDDESIIDPNTLGDWRKFRMNLANSNAAVGDSSDSLIDGVDLMTNSQQTMSTVIPTAAAAASIRPKSVSKKNEELLAAQNADLAEEYFHGVWAHESAIPEVGGLVCRMPLEAEIYKSPAESIMHDKLKSFLESDEYGRMEGSNDMMSSSTSLSSSASTGGAASAAAASSSSVKTTSNNNTNDDDDDDISTSFSIIAANTIYWYRGAERLLRQELAYIMSTANPDGRIDPTKLSPDNLDLLQRYMDHQNSWQSVCLVIDRNERSGYSRTITINRPMAFKLSRNLGMLVLFGAQKAEKISGGLGFLQPELSNGIETQSLVKFLSAFENQCAIYVGGQDGMNEPAELIHGIHDLPGSVEISPGTGIYRGGLDAAMTGVLTGLYKPLDFRFFIGHTSYEGGRLDEAVRLGKYQPVACSRPLVLKQCIQLPKPLWHEVLEFCGGEMKEISKLEFRKRSDLQ